MTVFDIINEEIEDMEVRKVQAEQDEELRRREHRIARIEGGIVSLKRLCNRLNEEHEY